MTDEPPNNSEEADPPSDLWSTVRPDQTHQEILDCLADQYVSELRSGKKPSITDYENQRPELSSEIRELLTSVGMIEELKLQSIPHPDSEYGNKFRHYSWVWSSLDN